MECNFVFGTCGLGSRVRSQLAIEWFLWPRFREKWNVANELQLNQIVIFKKVLGKRVAEVCGASCLLTSFDDLCKGLWRESKLSRHEVVKLCYKCKHAWWLCLLLADRYSRLDYKRVWDSKAALRLMMGVWNCSLLLSQTQM